MGIFDLLFGKKKRDTEPVEAERKTSGAGSVMEAEEPASAPQKKEEVPVGGVLQESTVTGEVHNLTEVKILKLGINKIAAIKAVRTYTSPSYSLAQAKAVVESVPCTLAVTDAAAFCTAMREAGFEVLAQGGAEPAGAGKTTAGETAPKEAERFRRIMTSQLLAIYLDNHEEAWKEEYLRRIRMCGLSEERALKYMAFEEEILRRCPRPEMLDENFLSRPCFSLRERVLPHGPEYYGTHFDYPLSYIIKLSDEAEWHFWNSHELDLPDPVWSEIYDLSDKNRKLFLPYAQNMVDSLGWSYQEVNKFSYNEQGMLDLYRWNRKMTRAAKQPWGIA